MLLSKLEKKSTIGLLFSSLDNVEAHDILANKLLMQKGITNNRSHWFKVRIVQWELILTDVNNLMDLCDLLLTIPGEQTNPQGGIINNKSILKKLIWSADRWGGSGFSDQSKLEILLSVK